MFINTKLIEEIYTQMKKDGKTEGFLDQESFGNIKIFINKKPKEILFSIKIDGDIIHIGTEQ